MASIQNSSGLPTSPELYEQEYEYWPWGQIVEELRKWLTTNVPTAGCVLDYMCGTAYLLNELHAVRPDVKCFGCSLTPEYIEYAKKRYAGVLLSACDARQYVPSHRPDVIICAAGLHHLPFSDQAAFVQKVASELDVGKWFVVAEEVVRHSHNEKERQVAALELHTAAIRYMIERGAPREVVATALDVLKADMLLEEFKLSRAGLREILQGAFEIVDDRCVWPGSDSEFGDVILVCRKR